jgi:lipopolysaccharide/colanic/teichoic acid biosynthesis glycosyltransferase
VVDHDAGELLPDDDRMTSFGRFLRRTSLDETPQLVSVLFGEMSLVGPRPLPVAYRDRYTPEQFRRHLATPGLTGLSVVRGRNAISWEEKLSLDVWYVDHWSLWLDVKILSATIVNVLTGRGQYSFAVLSVAP